MAGGYGSRGTTDNTHCSSVDALMHHQHDEGKAACCPLRPSGSHTHNLPLARQAWHAADGLVTGFLLLFNTSRRLTRKGSESNVTNRKEKKKKREKEMSHFGYLFARRSGPPHLVTTSSENLLKKIPILVHRRINS